jgi:hypothetical protein
MAWAGDAVEPRTITGRTRSSSGQHTATIRLSRLHFLSIGASRQRLEFFVARQGGRADYQWLSQACLAWLSRR